ncbi:Phosphate acetyltransferase [Austwickia sp. TVS 96-490-7B]|uniref:phosphate acyltransferase n=1 Tax=Austwickia sp. TVS 96-490-7B TaxID=2830843 RepID=UPI001C565576|nr:phosphate acyltransferase [Austwickia sp. TVS 96-490-7B]MBW3084763.1 Phosphate acetyltransferase [Austwickia sp. TVS 96-490-7B]
MARRILVVPVSTNAGVTAACLGLVHALERRHISVGYCKPFAQARGRSEDHSTELIRLATAQRPPEPIAVGDLEYRLAGGRLKHVMTQMVDLTAELDADRHVLVLEGLASSADQPYADRINIEVAQALDAEVVLVGAIGSSTPERFADQAAAAERIYRVRQESRVVGVLANHVPTDLDPAAIQDTLRLRGLRCVGQVTDHAEFIQARVGDIVRELNLRILSEGDLGRRIASTVIVAQSIPGFLSALTDGALVVVPGDRHEVLLSAALAETVGTKLAGLLLTAGIEPHPDVMALVGPALNGGLPLLLSAEKTFPTTQAIVTVDRDIPADDEERAHLVRETVADAFDETFLAELPRAEASTRVTPAQFAHRLRTEMRKGRIRLVLADGADPRVLQAVVLLQRYEALQFTVVGRRGDIEARLAETGEMLPLGTQVIDPDLQGPAVERVRQRLTEQGLGEALDAAMVAALALLEDGKVDGVIGGLNGDRAGFIAGARAATALASDVVTTSAAQAAMLPDEVLFFADTLINAHPDARQLACIAHETADTARMCGLTPRIAFVAPSSWSPTAQEDRDTIGAARALLAEQHPDLVTRGPVSFQEAIRRTSAMGGEPEPTIFVFPDLASAAATVKAIGQSAGSYVHPPVLQGLSRAVSLLPKDAEVDSIMDVIVYTAVKAAALG